MKKQSGGHLAFLEFCQSFLRLIRVYKVHSILHHVLLIGFAAAFPRMGSWYNKKYQKRSIYRWNHDHLHFSWPLSAGMGLLSETTNTLSALSCKIHIDKYYKIGFSFLKLFEYNKILKKGYNIRLRETRWGRWGFQVGEWFSLASNSPCELWSFLIRKNTDKRAVRNFPV